MSCSAARVSTPARCGGGGRRGPGAERDGPGLPARADRRGRLSAPAARGTPEPHRAIRGVLDDPAPARRPRPPAGLREEARPASLDAGNEAARCSPTTEAARPLRTRALARRPAPSTPSTCSAARPGGAASGRARTAVARCREASRRRRRRRAGALYQRLGEYHFWDDETALECYELGTASSPRARRGCSRPRATRRWGCGAGRGASAPRSGAQRRARRRGSRSPSCSPTWPIARRAGPTCGEALALAGPGQETARAYLHLGELRRVRGDNAGALRRCWRASEPPRGSGSRSFGTSCTSTAPMTCSVGRWNAAAGAWGTPRAWTSRAGGRAAPRGRGKTARVCGDFEPRAR